jgi:hypothetical protein
MGKTLASETTCAEISSKAESHICKCILKTAPMHRQSRRVREKDNRLDPLQTHVLTGVNIQSVGGPLKGSEIAIYDRFLGERSGNYLTVRRLK